MSFLRADAPNKRTVATSGAPKFRPPQFGKFGSLSKDLFKKKYDYDYTATFKNRTADGYVVETSAVASNNAPLRGLLKSSWPVKSLGAASGVVESEFHTVPDRESKISYQFNKLAPGLSVKLGLTGVKPSPKGETPDFPEGWASAELEYKRDYLAAQTTVRTNQAKTMVDASLALGYNNLSVGGKVSVDAAQLTKKVPEDFNYGVQYDGVDYSMSLATDKKHTVVNASYFQNVSTRQTVGAQFTQALNKAQRTLTFGSEYRVDPDTTIRGYAKVDSSKDSTTVAAAVQHRLVNPNALVGVAAEFDVAPNAVSTNKYGLTLTFGDM